MTQRRDYECKVGGVFPNEDDRDVPDPNLVEALAAQFPTLPHWMISAAILFDKKNPHYAETGVLGKKMLTGKQKRSIKRNEEVLHPFITGPEWLGPTPDEHVPISQEEAIRMSNDPHKALVSNDAIVKPVEPDIQKIQEIVSTV